LVILGSGTGFVGIAAAKLTKAERVILTDCHPSVLGTLQVNASINAASSACIISVMELDWFDNELPSLPKTDIIVASDVVYDPSLAKPLVEVFKKLLSKSGHDLKIVICISLRNEETIKLFLRELHEAQLRETLLDTVHHPVGSLKHLYTMIAPSLVFDIQSGEHSTALPSS
jgi:predicted nicotinamide N-methyase